MKRAPHPLTEALRARVRLLATTLRPSTARQYACSLCLFLDYLRRRFPEVQSPDQLRRDPHILGWLEHLWQKRVRHSGKPWVATTRAAHLIRMRKLLELLLDHVPPPPLGLLLSEDIPRPDQLLPRPLLPEDDLRLQAELRRRNDLFANALLLTRLTGMRIGETVDLAADCLRHLGGDDWAVHVPLGKLHSERLTPVDAEARAVIARLQFLRTLPPAAAPERLLPRRRSRELLCMELRAALAEAARQAGIQAHVVPHQLRHTYATTMMRAGVSMPGLMKLLGHRTANMTLRYVEVTQQDVQREFHLARSRPRHLLVMPPPLTSGDPHRVNAEVVMERLSAAIRVLDLFRQRQETSAHKSLQLLLRRLVRIRSRFQKLNPSGKNEK